MSTISFVYAALPVDAEDEMFRWHHYKIWKIIGIELGFGLDSLYAIEKVHASKQECLQTVIDRASPVQTHETMVKVLQSVNIKKAIAAGIIMRLSIAPQAISQYAFKGTASG